MKNSTIWCIVGVAVTLAAGCGTRPPSQKIIELGGNMKLEMVLVPAGAFIMGDDTGLDDAKPVHKVTITKPFYLGKYEVTIEQFRQFVEPDQGLVGDQVGHISVFDPDGAVFNDVGMIIVSTALADGVPGAEPMLGRQAVAQMPFAAQGTDITLLDEGIGVGPLAGQVLDGLALIIIAAIRIDNSQAIHLVFIDIAAADPVMDAVGRWDITGQD